MSSSVKDDCNCEGDSIRTSDEIWVILLFLLGISGIILFPFLDLSFTKETNKKISEIYQSNGYIKIREVETDNYIWIKKDDINLFLPKPKHIPVEK